MRGNSDILRLVLKKKKDHIDLQSFSTEALRQIKKKKYDINFRICFILKTVKLFKVHVVLFI